ncbi:MAG: hypothetical protein KAS07_05495, partial [Candidatus Pacebacteria bacterium]|nr:hypothetical protein [Candidatus Paceibacterota bacterium]
IEKKKEEFVKTESQPQPPQFETVIQKEVMEEPVPQKPTVEEVPVKKEPFDLKTHSVSGEGEVLRQTSANGKKLLSETMLEQARQADKMNPLVSHQSEIPIPLRPSVPVSQKNETISVPQKKIVSTQVNVPTPPIPVTSFEGDSGEDKLASASNTKIVFDGKLELDGERVLKKHELRQQQNELFDKFVEEQIETVVQVISGKSVVGEEAEQKVRQDLIRQSQKIIKREGQSISQKLHDLEQLFVDQRHRYAAANQVRVSAPIEDLVDTVVTRAEEEIKTKDVGADKRFKETLHNTLLFKAKHLFGIDMEKNKIQSALDEEYIKHKSFYLKSVK